jgi:hypothetical protein
MQSDLRAHDRLRLSYAVDSVLAGGQNTLVSIKYKWGLGIIIERTLPVGY